MPLIILALGIVFLFVMLVKFKLNAFLSLMLACLVMGFAEGLPIMKVISSIEAGLGGTLGHLAIILALGAMFGKLIADGGGAQRISMTLIERFGKKNVTWAVALTGFIVGITLFWEVSFVVLIPIVFTITITAEIPLLSAGIPMMAAISTAHCLLPPHPGPVAAAGIFKADIGLTLIYGIIIAIPTLMVAGPLFYKLIKNTKAEIPSGLAVSKVFKEEELPGFGISIITALIPVILIAVSLLGQNILPKNSYGYTFFSFVGNTDMALLIAYFVSLYTFGFHLGKRMPDLMNSSLEAAKSIAMILLIIGGGGAFKQVIIDSGVGKYVAGLATGLPISPLILGWFIAAIIRVTVGSATVALFMAAGVVLPLFAQSGLSPELMVLAVASGSMFFDPPTDAGFWMVKEYFGLSFIDTIKISSVQTTIISVMGLIGVLILNMIV